MKISIGNLTITDFCSQNIEHVKFRTELAQDDSIYEFVSIDIENDLHEVSNQEQLEFGNYYIIQEENRLVGCVYVELLSCEDKNVELRYAVHPEYRRMGYLGYSDQERKGYGEQILEECSHYLFTFDNIDSVDLHIRKDNEASIGCAKKAKYKKIGENYNEYYDIYRIRKNVNYED